MSDSEVFCDLRCELALKSWIRSAVAGHCKRTRAELTSSYVRKIRTIDAAGKRDNHRAVASQQISERVFFCFAGNRRDLRRIDTCLRVYTHALNVIRSLVPEQLRL